MMMQWWQHCLLLVLSTTIGAAALTQPHPSAQLKAQFRPSTTFKTPPLFYKHRDHVEERLTSLIKKEPLSSSWRRTRLRFPVVTTLCASQAILLLVVTLMARTWMPSFWNPLLALSTATSTAVMTYNRAVLVGVLTATATILVEMVLLQPGGSNDYECELTNLVVTLFGQRRRKNTTPNNPAADSSNRLWHVTLATLGLTTLTSVTDEVLFCGLLPAFLMKLLACWPHPLPWPALLFASSSLVYGIVHQSHHHRPISPPRRPPRLSWHRHPAVAGLGLGLLAWATNSLLPGMVAHILYDMHVLCSRWHVTNNQIDWAAANNNHEADLTVASRTGLSATTLAGLTRFFYAFDVDHAHALTMTQVQKAVTYAFFWQFSSNSITTTPPPSTLQVQAIFASLCRNDDQARIRLPQFLELLLTLRSQQRRQLQPQPKPPVVDENQAKIPRQNAILQPL